jgi:hypothetical protein
MPRFSVRIEGSPLIDADSTDEARREVEAALPSEGSYEHHGPSTGLNDSTLVVDAFRPAYSLVEWKLL